MCAGSPGLLQRTVVPRVGAPRRATYAYTSLQSSAGGKQDIRRTQWVPACVQPLRVGRGVIKTRPLAPATVARNANVKGPIDVTNKRDPVTPASRQSRRSAEVLSSLGCTPVFLGASQNQ